MSLIHEALEKLEKEKGGPAEAPPINTPVKLPTRLETFPRKEEKAIPSENTRLIFAIGGALLLLLVIGLIYLAGHSLSSLSSSPAPASASEPARHGLFVLTGITGSEGDLIAVINNQLVRVGDRVSGASVVEIQKDQVVIEANGRRVTLTL